MTSKTWHRLAWVMCWLVLLSSVALADPISVGIGYAIIGLSNYIGMTAAVAVVGGALGAGAAAGLYYLSSALNALARPKPGEAPQREVSITTAQEGDAIARVYGTFGVGGHCIARGTITYRTQSSGGGKKRAAANATLPSTSLGFLVCENINDTVLGISRIWLADELMYMAPLDDLDGTNPAIVGTVNGSFIRSACNARRMQILLGQSTQTQADRCQWFYPTLADAPGYRGYVTVWFDDMDLEPTHTLLPQLKFEVVTSADIYTTEAKLTGLEDADLDFDLSAVGESWFVLGPTPPKQTFQMLNVAHPFQIVEADGVIKGFSLPVSSSVTVPEGDLAAIPQGREEVAQAEEKPIKFQMGADLTPDTPRRCVIKYYDSTRAYEPAAQGVARSYASGERVLEYNLNGAFDRDNIAYICAQTIGRIETERDQISESLLPKYIRYHPGDCVTLPLPNGQFVDARIDEMEIGPGENVPINATRQLRLGGLGPNDGNNNTYPPDPGDEGIPILSAFILSNVPPLVDEDDGFDGIYWAAGPSVDSDATDPPSKWLGATLIRNACGSDDTNKQYYAVAATKTVAVIGIAKTVLASGTGVDATNTVDISFPYGEGTTTVLGIHNAAFAATTVANLCVLGKEVMQFRDITDVSGSYAAGDQPVYRLSQLKRGLRDTSGFAGTHAVGDAFFLWDPEAVIRVDLNVDEQGGIWNYKALTSGQAESEINNPVSFSVDATAGTTVLHVHTHT